MNKISELINKRIFIVGTPRSGTTLLQNLLVSDSRIYSFPESHFFRISIPKKGSFRYRYNFPTKKSINNLNQFYKAMRANKYRYLQYVYLYNLSAYSKFFIRSLDSVTIQNGKDIWLEKTPMHLHYIDEIQKIIPDAYFIHLVRDPEKVAASIYEVTNNHPEHWSGKRTEVECIQRWIKDIKLTDAKIGQPYHYLLKYHDLIQDSSQELLALYEFLGLSDRTEFINNDNKIAVSTNDEVWKKNSFDTISKNVENKFLSIFSDEQRDNIRESLLNTDIDLKQYASQSSLDIIFNNSNSE